MGVSQTYTVHIPRDDEVIEVEFDLKMTYKGSPASGPSWSSPGEPEEPPEFEQDGDYRCNVKLTDAEEAKAYELAEQMALNDDWSEYDE
jgi:hypothetical protein